MIPIEQQVVSLALAQRLAAMGVEQKSYFVWYEGLLFRSREVGEAGFAAFTVPELAALLGENFSTLDRFTNGGFMAYNGEDMCSIGSADTMAEALGLLLLAVLGEKGIAQNGGGVLESESVE